MQVPLLDLKAQFKSIESEALAVMTEIARSQQFVLGPWVTDFENKARRYLDAGHAIGVSSGSDALLVALMAFDIGPGDAVLTSPYTFFSTAGSIARLGATPVFVDIDPLTFQIDPAAVAQYLDEHCRQDSDGTRRTPAGDRLRAIMPVHLYGACADMEALHELASQHDLRLIEDTAQAFGAQHPTSQGPRFAGTTGDAGCYSFYPSKNLGAFGDAGLVVCRDKSIAEKIRQLRNHGMEPKYHHATIGGNFRLDSLQAGVLSIKLKHLDEWSDARRTRAAGYRALFAEADLLDTITLPGEPTPPGTHIYHQFVIRAPARDKLIAHLQANQIGCEIYYPIPLHLQDCFAGLGYSHGDFPVSEKAALETLALPIYPELSAEQQGHVVRTIREFYSPT
jgi:dTDP-4-amino-4,6-dideoxygalactose transaminase